MHQLCIKSKHMDQTYATHLCLGNSLQTKIFSFNKLILNQYLDALIKDQVFSFKFQIHDALDLMKELR